VVLFAPFAFVTTFAGTSISPLDALLPAGVLAGLGGQRRQSTRSALGSAAALFAALMLIPVLLGSAASSYVTLLMMLLAAGWLAWRTASEPGGLQFVLGIVVLSAAVQGALAIWEFKSGHRLNLYSSSGQESFDNSYFFGFGREKRPAAALPDPISLGNVLALALPLILALGVSARSNGTRALTAGAAAITALGLALSFSRMSWIGAAVGVLVAVVLLPPRRRAAAALGVVAVAVAIVLMTLSIAGSAVQDRFSSIADPTNKVNRTSDGDRTRAELWSAALTTAEHHPVLGVGFGDLEPYLAAHVSGVKNGTHAHSTYLQLLAEGGLVGALALLLLLGSAALDVARGLRNNQTLVAGMGGSLVAMLIFWSTDFTVRYSQVSVIIAVILGAVASQSSVWLTPSTRRAVHDAAPRSLGVSARA
jgi:O-antigen ligase